MNLGDNPIPPAPGTTTSIGWRMGKDEVTYVWEGTASHTGAVVAWLAKDLGLIPNAKASEEIARTVPDCGGVYLVPAFTGLGAPYYDDKVDACILGSRSGTKKGHIVRAALDCIAYQVKDLAESMAQTSGSPINHILVDGGITHNELVMQFQTDLLQTPISRSDVEESSELGVVLMAGLAIGLYPDKDYLRTLPLGHDTFEPKMSREEAEKWYEGWKRAIRQARYQG